MASTLESMFLDLLEMASNPQAMASNQIAMASNLIAMAFNLIAMASNLVAMASTLVAMAFTLQLGEKELQHRALLARLHPSLVFSMP